MAAQQRAPLRQRLAEVSTRRKAVEKHGEAQVKVWRRSYDIPPPPLSLDDPRHPRFDPRYADVGAASLPAAESLKDTLSRVLPYWESRIVPELRANKDVLIVAHGNSLRALVKMLDMMSESDIVEFNIPTGIPILYELDEQLQISRAAPSSAIKMAVAAAARCRAPANRKEINQSAR